MKKYLDWLFIAYLASILTMLAVFTACTATKQIEHTADIQHTTDTLRIYKDRVDSIYFRDSVYFKEYIKGDTIFSIQYKEKTRWQLQKSVDTVYIAKHDTIVKTETKETTIEKKKTFWDKWCNVSGYVFLIGIVFVTILFIVKLTEEK